MRCNIWNYTGQVLVNQHSHYSDPAASFDGINTKQTYKIGKATVIAVTIMLT
jgi:hypothetical protein